MKVSAKGTGHWGVLAQLRLDSESSPFRSTSGSSDRQRKLLLGHLLVWAGLTDLIGQVNPTTQVTPYPTLGACGPVDPLVASARDVALVTVRRF
jgi:hypothetical protein